jgi:outer membrane protein assembly factor BamD (BamD/ComL family)
VRVIDDDGTTTELGIGESRTFVERARAELTPSQWVAQARARRNAGDAKGAIAAYEQLIERHPTSAAARTAMVSLGQLHLDLDEPRPALKWFERYLAKPGGPLAEDAAYGRIRALGALGRTKAEREAVDDFLSSYPASSYAAKLRDR